MTTTTTESAEGAMIKHARIERSVDEIATEIKENGYSNLSDAEIDRFIAYKTKVAGWQGGYEATMDAEKQRLQEIHDTQQAIAEAGKKQLQALINGNMNGDE